MIMMPVSGYMVAALAALLAGTTHATMAAPLMLFEMTGSYDLILRRCHRKSSTAVSRVSRHESIYTTPAARAAWSCRAYRAGVDAARTLAGTAARAVR